MKSFEKEFTGEIINLLSSPEETAHEERTPAEMTLEEMEREETAKLNLEELDTDPEAFLERWQKAQEAALERYFKTLEKRGPKRTHRFIESYAEVGWDLRKKRIEEAKSPLQKQPKRLQTR